MATGSVKHIFDKKGFGFITPDEGDEDLYFHIKSVETGDSGIQSLSDGDRVSYEDGAVDANGRKIATHVVVLAR
ncbi:cold-shock protein [Pseudomonas abieticivorans]|uniref:cold-shock protein n=1 Tax=Pseudomonas abieticivorans TaxID=2931382 RepID=UPI0020C147FB|nr:cold shock domain-containing protein [Pseudomonas sp. PIA16]